MILSAPSFSHGPGRTLGKLLSLLVLPALSLVVKTTRASLVVYCTDAQWQMKKWSVKLLRCSDVDLTLTLACLIFAFTLPCPGVCSFFFSFKVSTQFH